MFYSPRIRLKALTQLCHRLAVATEGGIKDFRVWQNEAERGSTAQRRHIAMIRDALERGEALSDAVRATGNFFPPLFRSMIEVGDVSGGLGRTYRRLSQHYDKTLAVRRLFLGRLVWPMFQLGLSLVVVGMLMANRIGKIGMELESRFNLSSQGFGR